MQFSPIYQIPKDQIRTMTPGDFVTSQYGRVPNQPHGDGDFTLNQAIRMTYIVDKITPAFSLGDNIITIGFYLKDDSFWEFDNDDLIITLEPGGGVIGKHVFVIPFRIVATIQNFKNQIPSSLREGQLLLYFGYKDLMQEYTDRPYPLSEPRYPEFDPPADQSGFDPISLNFGFYNPETKKTVVGTEWDVNENKILLTSELHYELDEYDNLKLWFNPNNRLDVEINGGWFHQQNGGYLHFSDIDGGIIEAEEVIDNKDRLKPFTVIKINK